mmetsp:Transcript_31443/g.68755  ORF Transcript_31443/g.68755 Transcript_31443/m.68755 type:complete len:225 (-) Transcript_31443:168-842(-)
MEESAPSSSCVSVLNDRSSLVRAVSEASACNPSAVTALQFARFRLVRAVLDLASDRIPSSVTRQFAMLSFSSKVRGASALTPSSVSAEQLPRFRCVREVSLGANTAMWSSEILQSNSSRWVRRERLPSVPIVWSDSPSQPRKLSFFTPPSRFPTIQSAGTLLTLSPSSAESCTSCHFLHTDRNVADAPLSHRSCSRTLSNTRSGRSAQSLRLRDRCAAHIRLPA